MPRSFESKLNFLLLKEFEQLFDSISWQIMAGRIWALYRTLIILLYCSWLCLGLNIQAKEPHALTWKKCLSSDWSIDGQLKDTGKPNLCVKENYLILAMQTEQLSMKIIQRQIISHRINCTISTFCCSFETIDLKKSGSCICSMN